MNLEKGREKGQKDPSTTKTEKEKKNLISRFRIYSRSSLISRTGRVDNRSHERDFFFPSAQPTRLSSGDCVTAHHFSRRDWRVSATDRSPDPCSCRTIRLSLVRQARNGRPTAISRMPFVSVCKLKKSRLTRLTGRHPWRTKLSTDWERKRCDR